MDFVIVGSDRSLVGDHRYAFGPMGMNEMLQQKLSMLAKSGGGVIPPGVYRPVNPLVLNGLSDVTLVSHGVRVVAGDQQTVKDTTGETLQLSNCQRVRLVGFSFDGNAKVRGTGQQVAGQPFPSGTVVLRGCSDIAFDVCSFTGSVMDDVCILSSTEAAGATPQTACHRITVRGCDFIGPAYRQQISAVSVIGLRVFDNTFSGQRGQWGQSIDIEANPQDQLGTLSNILIDRNTFTDCHLPIIVNSANKPSRVIISRNDMDHVDIGVSNWADGTIIRGHVLTNVANIGIGSGVCLPTGNCGAGIIIDNVSDGPMPIFLDGVAGHRVGRNIGAITATPAAKGWTDLGGNQ